MAVQSLKHDAPEPVPLGEGKHPRGHEVASLSESDEDARRLVEQKREHHRVERIGDDVPGICEKVHEFDRAGVDPEFGAELPYQVRERSLEGEDVALKKFHVAGEDDPDAAESLGLQPLQDGKEPFHVVEPVDERVVAVDGNGG